jgi:hypothetical protein
MKTKTKVTKRNPIVKKTTEPSSYNKPEVVEHIRNLFVDVQKLSYPVTISLIDETQNHSFIYKSQNHLLGKDSDYSDGDDEELSPCYEPSIEGNNDEEEEEEEEEAVSTTDEESSSNDNSRTKYVEKEPKTPKKQKTKLTPPKRPSRNIKRKRYTENDETKPLIHGKQLTFGDVGSEEPKTSEELTKHHFIKSLCTDNCSKECTSCSSKDINVATQLTIEPSQSMDDHSF